MKRRYFIKHTLAGAALTALATRLSGGSSKLSFEANKILQLAGTEITSPPYTWMFRELRRTRRGRVKIWSKA